MLITEYVMNICIATLKKSLMSAEKKLNIKLRNEVLFGVEWKPVVYTTPIQKTNIGKLQLFLIWFIKIFSNRHISKYSPFIILNPGIHNSLSSGLVLANFFSAFEFKLWRPYRGVLEVLDIPQQKGMSRGPPLKKILLNWVLSIRFEVICRPKNTTNLALQYKKCRLKFPPAKKMVTVKMSIGKK